jgi:hypothetical protein
MLGLPMANEIMKSLCRRLLFPEAEAVGLPEGFGGAEVALAFGEST